MKWHEILDHPFVSGHILISEDNPAMPLTGTMTASTIQAKEQQRKEHTKTATNTKYLNCCYFKEFSYLIVSNLITNNCDLLLINLNYFILKESFNCR